MSDPVLRLDRSKQFATEHGDRQLDDPLHPVHFWQDGLPFDAGGVLVPDDGKKTQWQIVIEGLPVTVKPLYDEKMRLKATRKLTRLKNKEKVEPEADELADDDEIAHARDLASDDVNLESWLRGQAEYEPFMIFAACRRRYSKNYTKLRDVVEDLVMDDKLVPESEVAGHLLRLLDRVA